MDPIKHAAADAAQTGKPASSERTEQVGKPSTVDATWAAMMIPHHQTGIQMAALAADKASTAVLRDIATRSKAEQEDDLPRLQQLIDADGKVAIPPEKQIEQMDKQDMQRLQSLDGPAFDLHWSTVVSGHHVSAIKMTEIAMAASASGAARSLQEELRTKQLGELGELNDVRAQLG